MQQTIREITPFEVPEGMDEEFLKGWNQAAERIRHIPGVIAVQMHESLDPNTRFRFVAVSEWGSALLYEAVKAQMSKAFEDLRGKLPFAAYPASYRLVVSAVAGPHPREMFPR